MLRLKHKLLPLLSMEGNIYITIKKIIGENMEVNYRKYQYHIATPPFNNHSHNQFHGKLIPYWRRFWKSLFSELGSDEGLCEDEIYWQDRITYITHNNKIAAIQFVACYKIVEFAYSGYAKRYLPPIFFKQYEENETGYVNTLQYLSVDPAYSYRKTGINFASVLMDMSNFHQKELQARHTITVARKAVGIHNMARKVGFYEYCKSTKHSVDVSIMQTNNFQRHPRKSVTQVSDFLWQNRNFLSKKEFAA